MKWIKENAIQLVGALLLAGAFWVTAKLDSKLSNYITRSEFDARMSKIGFDLESIVKTQDVRRDQLNDLQTRFAVAESVLNRISKNVDEMHAYTQAFQSTRTTPPP